MSVSINNLFNYSRSLPPPFDTVTNKRVKVASIYNTGSRMGLIESLNEMRGELSAEETELLELTDRTLRKLQTMTDDEFAELELYPDFDE